MGIRPDHLQQHIIEPTLRAVDLYHPAAAQLLLGTAAQESLLGTYLRQHPTGPALGIYQMEAATHNDIVNNFLAYRESLTNRLQPFIGEPHSDKLVFDLRYATIFVRLHYLRVPAKLPAVDDIHGLAAYWKQYYNTPLGKGTVEEFVNNYKRQVAS